MRTALLLTLLVLPALASGRGVRDRGREEAVPDRIQTVSGKTHEGRVLKIGEDTVLMRIGSKELSFDREDVAHIDSSLMALPAALLRAERIAPSDFGGHGVEALRLGEQGLPFEADLHWWQALMTNPSYTPAHEALGHRKRRGSWVIPHRGRSYPLDRLQEERADWGGAWEFSTTHFDLRSNLELPDVVESCWGAERVYRAFFDLFGTELELYEITEPMSLWLHADSPSYRDPGSGRSAYFSDTENRVSIDASRGLTLRTVVRETTHQLLYNASRSKGGSGSIPAWVDEGLAQYMETVVDVRRGATSLTPARANGRLFATHALSGKPYRLSRVLTFANGDYWSSTRLGLKYAQAYTLVHFCLHGGGGAYREAFMSYLRGAFQGKGSSTHFKKAIGIRERELEKAWVAYVAASTGRR